MSSLKETLAHSYGCAGEYILAASEKCGGRMDMDCKIAVEMRNITKYYEKTNCVFKDMTVTFPSGKIIGLIGENGSGKTTFIKLISGMTKQNAGDIFVLGERVDDEKSTVSLRNHISVMGDANRALYWNMTGMENAEYFWVLKMGTSAKKMPKHILDYIKDFNMEGFIDRRVETYSKGMKQRLLLFIALLSDPSVLFMDEPLNGLDYDNAIILKQMINIYAKNKGGTVFITSHDQNFLNEVCDLQYKIKNHGITVLDSQTQAEKNMVLYLRINDMKEKKRLMDKYKTAESAVDNTVLKVETVIDNAAFYRDISDMLSNKSAAVLEARAI